ncbi:phytanoyl-CoA dioxygenase [Thozetella sp. PMI_491]|nr:phytanoyl-CoA dioxygenase [Thozetella sp. PMI_491]
MSTTVVIEQPGVQPKAVSHPAEKPRIIPSPALTAISEDLPDFRGDLARDGYVVIKNAVPVDTALAYQEKAWGWLSSFKTGLDFQKPETWVQQNLPQQNSIRTFAAYCVAHEKFMWDARLEPGVLDTFSKLWGTEELLVSFDSLNITFPNRKDIVKRTPWEHIDQSPMRRGLHCVQGILALSPSGPKDGGLVVFPGSHKLNDEFFDTQTERQSWVPLKDIYLFNKEQKEWFLSKGLKPHKVEADVGDLIIWDSRTIHYGAEPEEESSQIRTAIYLAYTPANWATAEQKLLKQQVFANYGGTTHWPHDHVVVRPTQVMLPDGTRDPLDRDEPLEKPEMTDRLLKLAGVKSY